MKEFKVLKIIDKFKFIYKRAGVDYDVLRIILKAKLTMDGRRKATVFNDTKKKKGDSNEFYKSLLMYGFIGIFLGFMLLIRTNIMYQMAVYFSAIMFMVLTIFISDFSYVILDVRDKNIIATKGINSKTINAAKITHVCIYIIYLTLALVGASFLISFKYGIGFFLIFLLEIILIDIFMIMITALTYLLVLKLFDGEKLKDIINFVQITLSIFIVLVYQIVPRLFQFIDVSKISYTEKIWHLLIPSMWFSAPLSMISGEGITFIKITMAILAIILPVVSIIIYFKLTPTFEKNLQKLNNNGEKLRKDNIILLNLSRLICKDNIERAFFNFSIGIINSEREFKLKLYPNLALAIAFPFIFMIIGLDRVDFAEIITNLQSSKSYLSIYAFAFVIPTILIMLRYSEKYMGAWIYKVAPIKNTSSIFKGVIKGAIYKLILPSYTMISIIFIVAFGFKVIIHLVIAFLVFMILIVLNFLVSKNVFPFSKKFEAVNGGEGIISLLFSILCILLALGVHFIIIKSVVAQYVYLIILIIINLLLWKFSFNIAKKKLIG